MNQKKKSKHQPDEVKSYMAQALQKVFPGKKVLFENEVMKNKVAIETAYEEISLLSSFGDLQIEQNKE